MPAATRRDLPLLIAMRPYESVHLAVFGVGVLPAAPAGLV